MTSDKIVRMVAMAKAGKSIKDASIELEMHYHTVWAWAKRLKIPFRHGLTKAAPKRRDRTPIGLIKSAGILEMMTQRERADSLVLLKKGQYSAVEALRVIGREDLAARLEEIEKEISCPER